MKRLSHIIMVPFMFYLFGCQTMEPSQSKLVATNLKAANSGCSEAPTGTQTVNAEGFVLNIKACLYYAGGGDRPENPSAPTPEEAKKLGKGDVYYIAYFKDSGAGMEKVHIQSDVVKNIVTTKNGFLINEDLYSGTPSQNLDGYIGVFADHGLPSNRTDQIKQLEKALNQAVTQYAAPSTAIPIIDIISLTGDLIDFIWADEFLFGNRFIINKTAAAGANPKPSWTVSETVRNNPNGTVVITIRQ